MGKRGRKKICDFCHDEDANLECSVCDVIWHVECALAASKDAAATERAVLEGKWLCEECERDNRNDSCCGKCSKEEGRSSRDSLLLCDGCPASYHMSCLGIKDEPMDDEWFCPSCAEKRPAAAAPRAGTARAGTAGGASTEQNADDKQDFCEVCQEGGRLLSCEFCPKAYHPSCIQQYLEAEKFVQEDFKWKCPVCEGHSILQRAPVVEYSENELKRRHADRDKQNKKQTQEVKARRNQFIRKNLDLVKPFLSKGFLTELKHVHPRDFELVDIFANPANTARLLSEGNDLKNYQQEAVNHLVSAYSQLGGYIMGLPMGAGKTVIALSFLSYLKQQKISTGPHLVIVPLSTVGNWQREANRFVPHLTVGKLCGSASEREFMLNKNEFWYGERDMYITTYETLINTENFFRSMHWGAVIMDEAHRIKRAGSRLKESLGRLSAVSRVMLSGTPLQNNLLELGELLNALWPDVISNMQPFEVAIEEGKVQDKKLVAHIKELLSKLMMYRKKDILNLPPKVTHTVWVSMTTQTLRLYKHLLDKKRALQGEAQSAGLEFIGARKLLKLMSQLRLLCCHPGAVLHHKDVTDLIDPAVVQAELAALNASGLAHLGASNKLLFLDKLLTLLDKLNRGLLHPQLAAVKTEVTASESLETAFEAEMGGRANKVLVFSQFTRSLNELETYLKWRGFSYMRMDGSTSRVVRELDMRDFNAPEDRTLVYLISTRAGGLGINLQSGNHVVVLDSDFNPHVDEQAIARAWRLGSTRKVWVWKLMTEWSVEERILVRQQIKLQLERQIIQAATGPGDLATSALTSGSGPRSRRPARNDDPNATEDEASEAADEASEEQPAGEDDAVEGAAASKSDELFGKLTAAEMSRMIDHGYAAISKLLLGDVPAAATASLEEFVARERAELDLDSAETSEADAADDEAEAEAVQAVVGENEGDTTPPVTEPLEPQGTQTGAAGSAELTESEAALSLMSGKRVRRAPQFFQQEFNYYESAVASGSAGGGGGGGGGGSGSRSALFHEHECFMCGDGGEVVECGACPKVYHLECQHLEAVPKGRWTCSWHECWDCWRKQSQVGELIHCVNCPRAYCLDCFPQSFRRTVAEPEFWTQLRRMGYEVSPANFIVFTCNDCRVFLEQEKRKKLAKEEHERLAKLRVAEAMKQKQAVQASLAAKLQAQARFVQTVIMPPQGPLLPAAAKPRRATPAASAAGTATPTSELFRLMQTAQETVRLAFEALVPAELEAKFRAEQAQQLCEQPQVPQQQKQFSKQFIVPCGNCRLPGHLSPSCPFPAERLAGPRSSACSQCRGNHQRLNCLALSPSDADEYKHRAKTFLNISNAVRHRSPLLLPQELVDLTYAQIRNLVALRIDRIVNELSQALFKNVVPPRPSTQLPGGHPQLLPAPLPGQLPGQMMPLRPPQGMAPAAPQPAPAMVRWKLGSELRTLQQTQEERLEQAVGPLRLVRFANPEGGNLQTEDLAVLKRLVTILKINYPAKPASTNHGIKARAAAFNSQP